MRPAKVSREVADRLMSEARARGEFPKPVPVFRPKKRLKRGKPLARTKTRIRRSPAALARIAAWPAIRRAIFERDGGICFWCGKACPYESGTAEHAIPHNPAAGGGDDVETNLSWIHHRPFVASCHDQKGRSKDGIVMALRALGDRYGVRVRLFGDGEWSLSVESSNFGEGRRFPRERDALAAGLCATQTWIDNGVRPSLLGRKP